ncbi:TonB-dependent receptor [Flavisolibacter ginsenosidimutans]|uniref:Outer membrane beta-barrel protein n=1 Tax=Flavisolibacter ginsenosidimutans TaxID=661481 RepID=A0A5B8UME7_9BACT|nr:TonB-dependent receptor [Flavisolibacter ginsenosidimutans]QEC57240.1 outer membrane beta-barrel protein [Flavisolibacter ginsenosidimutans]
MYRRILPLIIVLFVGQALYAQYTLSGTVKDQQAGTVLSGASVKLKSLTDSSFARTALSDAAGRFSFQNLSKDSFLLSVSFVGYGDVIRSIRLDSSNVRLDSTGMGIMNLSVTLVPGSSKDLATVVITSRVPPAVQKADTLQMDASQYKVNPDASTEDLVKKMPGITVENGQVKAQGDVVQKVTIDGRDLFGDDATAALRNLPAEIVDKIQVFDRLSDQAAFTGFDDGSATKSINIVTKANMRNGQYGRVFAGYGTDDRYAAGGNATIFKNNRRISVVGNFNNVNQQNFSQQDLLGVTSNAQRGGGGGGGPRGARGGGGGNRGQGSGGFGGGGNFGGFGSNANFLVGQQAGINKTNAFGINYSDMWGKKLTVTGSYFFNNTGNTTNSTSSQQYYSGTVYNQATNSSSNNNNNRVNMRIEWKLDSANQILFMPNLSFQNNNSNQTVTTNSIAGTKNIGATTNNTNSNRTGNNLNNTILYRHSFAKRGRTFSINLNTSSNDRTGGTYTNSLQRRFDSLNNWRDTVNNRFTDQNSNGYQLSANLVYTEPLGLKSQLQVNYSPSYSKSKADQQAFRNDANGKYTLFDTTLSNRFDNTTKTQSAGLAYRYGDRDNQLSFGANYQHNNLLSDQTFPRALNVNKSFSNVLPNAMVRLKLSTRSSVRLFYRANTNNPSVTQLSDVVDVTNRPYITAGNPDLKQQLSNTVNGRYTYTNPTKGILFVANLFYQTANDYISNATYIDSTTRDIAVHINNRQIPLSAGEQLTVPVNLDGYRSVRSFLTFAFPMHVIKSNVNLNGGVTFSRLPGSINGVTNISRNTTYTAGAVIASNISQYVDFTVSYTANFNKAENDIQPQYNDSYFQHVAGVQLNLLSKNGWFFQNDISNQLYNGLTQGYNQNYTLWNMSAGKKFLKDRKGELKLSVFDLLRQNQSITRNVTETYIEDVQSTVLRQYLLLTFTYNLRNFGTASARAMNRGEGGRNFGDGPRF